MDTKNSWDYNCRVTWYIVNQLSEHFLKTWLCWK